jgi:PhnB protein
MVGPGEEPTMRVTVYLSFDGRCAEAFDFYAHVLGGTVEAKHTWGETPHASDLPPEQHGKIMHSSLRVGDRLIFGADAPPEWRSKPEGFSVSVNVDDAEEGRRIFDALAEGGTVKMGFEPTFWSKGFGMLVDRYEIPWMVNVDASSA